MDCNSGKFRRAVIYLLVLIGGATGVKNLEMIVPAMVRSGDSARLSCHYVLEGAPLYTVQWYLGEQEFYRYVPKKLPPQLIHPVQGIEIDALHSNMNDVVLRNVSREVAGMYKCEVSEDGPSYHTVLQKQLMQIADTAPKSNNSGGPVLKRKTSNAVEKPQKDIATALIQYLNNKSQNKLIEKKEPEKNEPEKNKPEDNKPEKKEPEKAKSPLINFFIAMAQTVENFPLKFQVEVKSKVLEIVSEYELRAIDISTQKDEPRAYYEQENDRILYNLPNLCRDNEHGETSVPASNIFYSL